MRGFLIVAATIISSANAAAIQARQRGGPDVSDCGLDPFEGHTAEAFLFCSSILKSGTATYTVTSGVTTTRTTTRLTTTVVYPTSSKRPITTPTPTPTPTPKPTPTPSPTPTSISTSKPSSPPATSSSSPRLSSSSISRLSSSSLPRSSLSPPSIQPSSTVLSSTVTLSPSPTPTSAPGCGIVAYVKTTAAYYFESSGTKNTFAACSTLCKADTKCKSFGYGEANCMLFDVYATDNTNYNPMSPYTFYDVTCPSELPVHKRDAQLDITLGAPEGITISLGLGSPQEISSARSCLITRGPGKI